MAALFASAAASLPLIACLTLIAGRRGNSLLCLWGGYHLLHFCLMLATVGPLWIMGSYVADVAQFGSSIAQKLEPLIHEAGLPWSCSCAAWVIGWLLAAITCALVRRDLELFNGDRYRIAYIKLPLIGCLAACLLFFASFVLINWPFAGLPQGLSWDRAVSAIIRHAMRQYFVSFSSAGALALVAALYWLRGMDSQQEWLSVRWLGVWASGGCLPGLLQNWGTMLGLGARGGLPGALAQGMWSNISVLGFYTAARACWCLLVWRPKYW